MYLRCSTRKLFKCEKSGPRELEEYEVEGLGVVKQVQVPGESILPELVGGQSSLQTTHRVTKTMQ